MSWMQLPCGRIRFLRLLCLLTQPFVLYGCGCQDALGGDEGRERSKPVATRTESTQSPKPNILLLLADDLGYNDLGIQSNDPSIPTPNMDQLARMGTRFTRFYTESTCTPSRAALLTGRYAARAGFRPTARGIPPEITTLPEALRAQGYATHHVGKWHLGMTVKEARPLAQGFDTSFGFLHQWLLRKPVRAVSVSYPTYYDPWLSEDDKPRRAFQGHLTDLLADRTIQLIERADPARPWFIYHAFFAPHTPIEPAKRFGDRFPSTPEGKYKALLSQLDYNVGRILERLRQTKQFDNTIIVLASDNGGTNTERDNNYPYFGKKATYFEGGVRVPLIIHWPERFESGTTFGDPVAIFDIYPTLLDLVSNRGVPPRLDGVSLVKAQVQNDLMQRDLFWESYVYQHTVYGVLTADNARLFRDRTGVDFLFNLTQSPTGDPKHAIDDLELAGKLRKKYEAWRSATRLVNTEWTPLGPRGHGILRGDDFQRSPGMAGYTFAIGVTPAANASDANHRAQIIAQQRGLLTISLDQESRVSVELDGQKLRSPPIEPPDCHSVVVSGFFNRRLSPKSYKTPRPTQLGLYVDGKRVDQKWSQRSSPSSQNLSEPTYIGQDALGKHSFDGQLSRPRVYNQERIEKRGPSFAGIEDIHALVCP